MTSVGQALPTQLRRLQTQGRAAWETSGSFSRLCCTPGTKGAGRERPEGAPRVCGTVRCATKRIAGFCCEEALHAGTAGGERPEEWPPDSRWNFFRATQNTEFTAHRPQLRTSGASSKAHLPPPQAPRAPLCVEALPCLCPSTAFPPARPRPRPTSQRWPSFTAKPCEFECRDESRRKRRARRSSRRGAGWQRCVASSPATAVQPQNLPIPSSSLYDSPAASPSRPTSTSSFCGSRAAAKSTVPR